MTKNQRLFERINSLYKEPSQYLSDWVGFHPWVLGYLLDRMEFEKKKVFIKERRRVREELIKKPIIFLPPTKKNFKIISNPTVSVITPSFNHGHFLEDTLNSVANQTYKNYEHIIIDGGSTDNTVKILKQRKNLKWISEKDSGYNEAFGKGLAMAKGKYIMNCAVSDGFANKNWFKKCVEILDSHKDVSMVWGFPQNLSEEGIPGKISYSQFHLILAPQKYDFFYFWLRTRHGFPEGNICVRKIVIKKCLAGLDRLASECDIWKEFNYNFNALGYLSYHIPVVANFGRAHNDQSGQKDMETGTGPRLQKKYIRKINNYRCLLITGNKTHIFRDGEDKILFVKFSATKLLKEYFINIKKRVAFQLSRFK